MKYTAAHWGAYEIDGDTLEPLSDDPSPSRIGKGWASAARDANSRILRPAVRKGWLEGDNGSQRCDDSYVEVPWGKATEFAASELARVKADYGNEAIYAGSYGWASAGRFHHAQSQLRRFLNMFGGFVSSRETYSHAAAEVIFPHITGMSQSAFQDGMTSWSSIVDHCTLLVSFGGISGRTGQVTSSGNTLHETEAWLKRMKGRQVSVAPQKSDMPTAEWLSIRPGTDVALMLALAHCLLENGTHNEAFLQTYTSGWPQFRDYLLGKSDGQPKSAQWAAALCDIKPDEIQNLASDMARNKTMINVSWSMQRSDHGEQTVWAGLALAAMLGQIGQPGCGFGFGYSGVGSVGRPTKIVKWPALPQGKNPIADFIPVSRISDMLQHPGERYAYNGQMQTYPDIKLVIWSGGNPFHHHQDLNRLSDAWKRPETVIVCDHSWTATARRADIVLPATSPLERHDIMMSKTDPSLLYMSPLFEAKGLARDDYDIMQMLAAKLGLEDEFTEGRNSQDWLNWFWEGARTIGSNQGVAMPDFGTFKQHGRFDLPNAEQERIALAKFIADPQANALNTESGKLTLFNQSIANMDLPDCSGHPTWFKPVETLIDAPEGALHLLSGQPDTRLHSQNDRGAESLATKVEGRECCRLHPQTAADRGVSDGSILRIFNERGATLAGVKLDSDIRQDCIVLPTGAWFDPAIVDGEKLEIHGNPNVLTIDQGASMLTQGNIAHTALVYVEPWNKPLPPLTIDRPPAIERS